MAIFGRNRGLVDEEARRMQNAIGAAHPPRVVEAPVKLRGNAGVTSVRATSANNGRTSEGNERPAPRLTTLLTRARESLVAAANRVERVNLKNQEKYYAAQPWQNEAWALFNEVGEQRFIVTALAGQLSRARLFVGEIPAGDQAGEEPLPVEDAGLQALLTPLGNGPGGRARLLRRLGQNLFTVGEGWLIGVPRDYYPGTAEYDERVAAEKSAGARLLFGPNDEDPDVQSLIWRMFSGSELSFSPEGDVTLKFGQGAGQSVTVNPDRVYMIRIWSEHPERSWEADAATRSSLPVLRELVGLTKHVSAQIDSRLAGAGILIVPQSADEALRQRQQAEGYDDDDFEERDAFTDDLIESMITPISDRDSASAVAPLVVVTPDEAADKFQHLKFSTPLDSEASELREESIRRLALGQDAPPELLLGKTGMNHWGAWLVQEDVITTHLTPTLALICEALTEQYLRPVMEAQGYTPEEAARFAVWYDVSHMITRPNRSRDAREAHAAGVISDEALRNAYGFEESDAPGFGVSEETKNRELAVRLALDAVAGSPSLLDTKGLPALVEEIMAALAGVSVPDREPAGDDAAGGIPETDDEDPGPESADD